MIKILVPISLFVLGTLIWFYFSDDAVSDSSAVQQGANMVVSKLRVLAAILFWAASISSVIIIYRK